MGNEVVEGQDKSVKLPASPVLSAGQGAAEVAKGVQPRAGSALSAGQGAADLLAAREPRVGSALSAGQSGAEVAEGARRPAGPALNAPVLNAADVAAGVQRPVGSAVSAGRGAADVAEGVQPPRETARELLKALREIRQHAIVRANVERSQRDLPPLDLKNEATKETDEKDLQFHINELRREENDGRSQYMHERLLIRPDGTDPMAEKVRELARTRHGNANTHTTGAAEKTDGQPPASQPGSAPSTGQPPASQQGLGQSTEQHQTSGSTAVTPAGPPAAVNTSGRTGMQTALAPDSQAQAALTPKKRDVLPMDRNPTTVQVPGGLVGGKVQSNGPRMA